MTRKNAQDAGKAKTTKVCSDQGTEKTSADLTPFYALKLFNLTQNAIAIFKPEDGTICDVNDLFCQGSGYSREEVIGKTSRDLNLFSEEVREKAMACIAKDGCFRNMEVQHRLKDGSTVTCIDSGDLFKIGDEYYVIVVAQDITLIKDIEESLHNENNLNKALTESLPGLFFIIDEKARFVRWNEKFMAVLGKTAEEMSLTTALDLHPEAGRKAAAERIRQGFLTGSFNHEESVVVNNGAEMTLLITANKIAYEGKPCLIGTCIDITEKKRMENALTLSRENLEEVNIALRVLMNQRNDDQKKLEEKLRNNINDLVIPYLKKLKQENLDERSKNYISILESNLQEVLSPFIKDFSYSHKSLTPQEIQIVDLIRKGHDTKEIAGILNASANTISTHRNNIRKKLNLRKSKTNLRSHILSLS
jgi:PAS domain S-box-containing protein